MYCIQCGVKLADTECRCPLCDTEVFHPNIARSEAAPLYPAHPVPASGVSHRAGVIVWTTLMLIAMCTCAWCDLQVNRSILWSGYVIGGLLVVYSAFVLPFWFRNPSAAVFVPCDFAAVGLYLLYINTVTGGDWFLTFALPVTAYLGILVTAVVILLKYVCRAILRVFGGALIGLGILMPLTEVLLYVSFESIRLFGWSVYPLITLVLFGAMLIFLDLHRPAREAVERKLFL